MMATLDDSICAGRPCAEWQLFSYSVTSKQKCQPEDILRQSFASLYQEKAYCQGNCVRSCRELCRGGVQKRGLKYGFVLAVVELASTIPTLWASTQEFRKEYPGDIPADNLLDFVTAKDGGYNLCHFWSNFEIGDLNFFRSREYQMYFEYLDRCCSPPHPCSTRIRAKGCPKIYRQGCRITPHCNT
jgi:hypothetical protein